MFTLLILITLGFCTLYSLIEGSWFHQMTIILAWLVVVLGGLLTRLPSAFFFILGHALIVIGTIGAYGIYLDVRQYRMERAADDR